MSRFIGPIVIGALLALLAVAAVVTLPAAPPTIAQRSDGLARELRCPDCQSLSVADSPTQSAREIRRQIDELVSNGATDQAVRDHFVARYGEWILLSPSSAGVWIIPFAVVLAGVALLAVWLIRRPSAVRPAVAELSAAERRRLRDEADALDA